MEPMLAVDFSRLPEVRSELENSSDVPRIRQELGFLYGMRRDIGVDMRQSSRRDRSYLAINMYNKIEAASEVARGRGVS